MKSFIGLTVVLLGLRVFAQGGVNTQTGSYTLQASDNGKLVTMNCSAACTVTLPAPPSSTFAVQLVSIGSQVPTVVLASGTYNGSSTVPALSASQQSTTVYTDGTNWFGDNWSTINAKVVNGVAYSALYPGASLDVRVNACIQDAENQANGVTTHRCSSLGEPATLTQSNGILAQINVGDSSGDDVEWQVPPTCTWSAVLTGGTNSIIAAYGKSSIIGTGQLTSPCTIVNYSAANGAQYMYATVGGDNYYHVEGLGLRNAYGQGSTLAGGAMMYINGAEDSSSFKNMIFSDYIANTIAMLFSGSGACCSVLVENNTFYANNTGGTLIEGTGSMDGVNFYNNSVGHSAVGKPLISITDSIHNDNVQFNGLYEEMTFPAFQISGYSLSGGILSATNSGSNAYTSGQTVAMTEFHNATYGQAIDALSLNGGTCTILSTGLSSTTFQLQLSSCSNWANLTPAQQTLLNGTASSISDTCFTTTPYCTVFATVPQYALNQINGGGHISFQNVSAEEVQSVAQINPLLISVSNSHATSVRAEGITANHGYIPQTAMVYNANLPMPYVGVTDAYGVLPLYQSNVSNMDTINAAAYQQNGSIWLGTNTSPGPLQCDNLTTFCNNGIISANGSGGTNTTATPAWLQFLGTGADGAYTAVNNAQLSGENYFTNFTVPAGVNLEVTSGQGLVVHATGTCEIAGTIRVYPYNYGPSIGVGGGSGGGGGGGTAAGGTGTSSFYTVAQTGSTVASGGAGGATSGGAGAIGATPILSIQRAFSAIGGGADGLNIGGAAGGRGGSTGGTGGVGGIGITLICSQNTGTDGTAIGTIDVSGAPGNPPTTNNTGAGAGGGGGVVILSSQKTIPTLPNIFTAPGAGSLTAVPEALSYGGSCTAPVELTLAVSGGTLSGIPTIVNAGAGCGNGADVQFAVLGGGGTQGSGTVACTFSSGSASACTETPGTSSGYTATAYTGGGTGGNGGAGWNAVFQVW